jgi:HK97 family phage major capsid protein
VASAAMIISFFIAVMVTPWLMVKIAGKAPMHGHDGADGGFLVPLEFMAQLFMVSAFGRYVRERALTVPMRHRQITMPTLDQTGTTAGQTNLYGGVHLDWTEESASKEETQPTFRQVPPRVSRPSAQAVLRPSWAARIAAT